MHHQEAINACTKPQFDGQLVTYPSPVNSSVTLLDEARPHEKYGFLEWNAVNPGDKGYERKLAHANNSCLRKGK